MAVLQARRPTVSRRFTLKKCLSLLISLCVLWLIVAHYLRVKYPSFSSRYYYLESEINNDEPQVDVLRITKTSGKQTDRKDDEGFVFILPKMIESTRPREVEFSRPVHHLEGILDQFRQYDGATCHALKHDSNKDHLQKLRSCWFEIRNWTMLISGPSNKKYHREHNGHSLWICNMVEFPFVMRRSVFNRVGQLKQAYGEASLLDFFLRSNGTLKIAVSQECVFTENQSKINQEVPKRQVYLDYGLLGHNHNILRVIRPDSITWTKCSYQNSSCPDIPEQQTRVDDILLPYCCKTQLNQILIQTVAALNQIGIDNRVCFGTLLGSIRSNTIIPWTQDADICIKTVDSKKQTFESLREFLKPTNYSYAFLKDKHRIVPLNAFIKHISDSSLVTESNLFSEQVLQYMQEMLPIPEPLWTRSPYADFYKYDKIFERNTINVTIDGIEYPTGDKPHELLREWFGKKYMSTDEKDRVSSGAVEKSTLFQKIIRLFQI